jgi:plastocyanin
MAGGKLAFQRGEYATAVEKWELLLKTPGLDRDVERAVTPALAEARKRAKAGAGKPPAAPAEGAGTSAGTTTTTNTSTSTSASTSGAQVLTPVKAVKPLDGKVTVSGTVVGGGEAGPGSAVVWLKRLDGPAPKIAPATGRFITQKDKTFIPHVLPVPVGTTVEFRNDDRIYHNVFSLNKPNDFDAGIRAAGSTYSRTFNKPGPVELLCNIHSTMNAYVVVIDTPYFTKARPSGAFTIRGVVPGRYEIAVWHESASAISRRPITVPADGLNGISVTVNDDRRPGSFVPDKYGHKRQPHLGY